MDLEAKFIIQIFKNTIVNLFKTSLSIIVDNLHYNLFHSVKQAKQP